MGIEPTIVCPSCRQEIKLTESLAAPLIEATRKQYETKIAEQRADFAKREQAVKTAQEQLAKDKESLDATVNEKLKAERAKLVADATKREASLKERETALAQEKENVEAAVAEKLKLERAKIAADEAKKARLALGNDLDLKTKELADLTVVLKQRDEKLAEAQKAQAQLVVKQRELDDAKREMELTIETRISESLGKTREQAKKEAEESLSLKLIEKETQIASMQQKIEELKKKAEQGSQQLQGEALESNLNRLSPPSFHMTASNPFPRANTAATSFSASSRPRVQCAERSFGNPNALEIGPMAGLPNCVTTSASPKRRLRSSPVPSCRRAVTRSIKSKASGSSIPSASCPSPCPYDTC